MVGYENHDDDFCWPKGWYGLTRSNEPDFVFPSAGLCSDPLNGYSDDEIDVMADDDPRVI